jgi:3-isopropylmalate/(R)-2-methylmalate dehydratase large subunit
MNIIQKILRRHSSQRSSVDPGDTVEVSIDLIVRLDYEFVFPEIIRHRVRKRAEGLKMIAVFDHYIPPHSIDVAEGHKTLMKVFRDLGIEDIFYGEGISHVLIREKGILKPGMIVVSSDSHTTEAGAMNALGRGVGALELLSIICSGRTWFQVPETLRIDLLGSLKWPAMAKDIFFSIARELGSLIGKGAEIGGPGLKDLSIDSRGNISAMFTELNVEFVVFEPDDLLLNYVSSHSGGEDNLYPVYPDGSPSDYVDSIRVILDDVEPMVAVPHGVVGNVRPVSEVSGTPIDVAYIGSCAGATYEDLASVARILKGRRVRSGVRLIVTPASNSVYRQALKSGVIDILIDAGAIVTNSSCGACFGGHLGIVGGGEVVVSSSTRNFRGRMGSPDARIYLASPATVASSAIMGEITDPRDVVEHSR